jgi:hypothetical protein
MRVWVSHVENPTEFYIQFKDDEDGLQAMSRQLNEALRDSSQAEIRKSEIKEEMMVAAVFSNDDLWYRAEVSGCYVNTSPAYVSVVYVDYGNSENVSIRNITKLPPGMESGPFYGHKCLLAGIQPPSLFSNVAPPSWSQKAITHFKNAVDPDKDEEEINVVMKEVCRNSDGYREVDLFTVSPDGSLRSVAHRLVQIGLAARCAPLVQNHVEKKKRKKRKKSNITTQSAVTHNGKILSAAPHPSLSLTNMTSSFIPGHPLLKATPTSISPTTPPLPPPHANSTDSPFVGQTLEMAVVQVNSPGEFYVQFHSYLTDVQPLLAQFQPFLNPKSEYSVGEMVLAPFQGERWFRGKVDRRLENGFEIFYMDYGNRGVVPAGELAAMPTNLGKFPPQALKAELAGVLPVNSGGVWGMDASVYFSNLILDKRVNTTIQSVSTESMKIHVHVDGDVGQTMILARMARPDPAFVPLPRSSCSTPNPPSSPPTVSIVSPESEVNPVSPESEVNPVSPESEVNPVSPESEVNPVSPESEVNPVSPEGPPPPRKLSDSGSNSAT